MKFFRAFVKFFVNLVAYKFFDLHHFEILLFISVNLYGNHDAALVWAHIHVEKMLRPSALIFAANIGSVLVNGAFLVY